jgi:predicted enzyme related to lactoylglutathione lyase
VDASRRFYCELFGWEAQEPSPEFGGYFMFTRQGVPIAGGMGDMGDLVANDTWKIYFKTDDINAVVGAGEQAGAQFMFPPTPVADLGVQTVFTDPTGATLGAWQPGSFQGFQASAPHGAPSWFELYARDYVAAVGFYESVFALEAQVVADSDEFRYTTMRARSGGVEVGGIMDARSFLPEGVASHWITYWEVADVDEAVTRVRQLGGPVTGEPTDTHYGRITTVTDLQGAQFKLRTEAS